MTEPMTLARFAALADAYGGSVARWPEEVRVAAALFAREQAARDILEGAERLDRRLDRWSVPVPGQVLRDRIVAAHRIRVTRRLRIWWAGLGLAIAATGAAAGTVATAAVLPAGHAEVADTIFGNLAGQDD